MLHLVEMVCDNTNTWVIKFNCLFWDSGHRVHASHVIITYTQYSIVICNIVSWVIIFQPIIFPLHRGCDLCASLVRPQNWPGRPWRQKGGRTVALVVQGWYTGRSDIAMDAMVAVKFWACSKQSHKVPEEVCCSQVNQRRQDEGTHIAVVAEWMHSGRPLVTQ